MTSLCVDQRGFVYLAIGAATVPLNVRYENGALEFVVKERWLWEEVGRRVRVPVGELMALCDDGSVVDRT